MPSAGLAWLSAHHLRRGLREVVAVAGTVQPSTLGHYLLAIGTSFGPIMRSSSLGPVIAVEMNRDLEGRMQDLLQRNDCAAMVRYVHGVVAPLPTLREPGPDPRSREPAVLQGADLRALTNGQTIALAKVDIEGSEFGLVRDYGDLLTNVQRLAMEVHPDFGDPVTLRDRLRSLGFKAWLADKSGAMVDRIVEPVGFCYALR